MGMARNCHPRVLCAESKDALVRVMGTLFAELSDERGNVLVQARTHARTMLWGCIGAYVIIQLLLQVVNKRLLKS